MTILIIDPGHGGKDPGGGSNDQFLEKNKVIDISLYQYKRFKELGIPVSITRTTDVYLSPKVRTDAVKRSGAKYCLSNHINAFNSTARGAETIYSIFSDGKLATKIYEGLINEGAHKRRVFKKEGANGSDHYFMHRETGSVETVIIEYGFATHIEDTKLIIDNWKHYAESVVKSFCEFIGHPYSLPQKEEQIFPDVANDRWSKSEIAIAVQNGLMKGYPDGTFRPGGNVSREELAVTLVRLLNMKGVK